MGEKVKMLNPLVEMDGDEMTRIIWQDIKDQLIMPYVELKTEYFDLGLAKRDETDDKITVEAAEATKKYGVAVKCATITPNTQRLEEYKLKSLWPSPNATIRGILDGTIFRVPIVVDCIKPIIPTWKKPITIARHAYGDIYKAVEFAIPGPGKVELLYTSEGGESDCLSVHNFTSSGVALGMHNTDPSIKSFARACFEYSLTTKQDLWFATKDTVSKKYDGRFKEIFEEVFRSEYKEKYDSAGIEFFYTLIDDAVARVMRSAGGFIWACKNYDGDVMSDMISTVFGSLSMMTSVLVSPNGYFEYEAAHGTVTRHYYKYLKGEKTSTNPMATIFAWTGALRKRGEIDQIKELVLFADVLEKASLDTIKSGVMTGDLVNLADIEGKRSVTTEDFLNEIAGRVKQAI